MNELIEKIIGKLTDNENESVKIDAAEVEILHADWMKLQKHKNVHFL